MVKYHTIVTHVATDIDEYGVMSLYEMFGEVSISGISELMRLGKVEYWKNGGEIPDGRSWKEWDDDGYFLIGVGGGELDEHARKGEPGRDGECATTLAARKLGLIDEEFMKLFLKFIISNNNKGTKHPWDIGYICEQAHDEFAKNPEDLENSPEEVKKWTMKGLKIKLKELTYKFNVTKKEFEEKAVIEEIEGYRGKLIKLVTIESDNPAISNLARKPKPLGCNAGIVIVKNNKGNIAINPRQNLNLRLDEVAKVLNYREQLADGNVTVTSPKELCADGMILGGKWCFFQKAQALLNGSKKATEVPPTQLSLDEIKESVKIGMNPYVFEKNHSESCRKGTCTSTRRNECPWFGYKLNRCIGLRIDARKSTQKQSV